MDCEYILQNEIHEKFLKGLLSENQKAELELHLKSCESCRKTFENEKAIFDGIRLAGRKAMKLEIERQVEKSREERAGTDWTLIFKVAAVLFFLVIMPGTLYFLNTDLFTKKAELAPQEKVDRVAGVEMEEAKPVEESRVLEDTEDEAVKREVASGSESRAEKSVSAARGKSVTDDLKDQSTLSKKRDDLESLQDVLGGVEGSAGAGNKGVSGAGALESVSKQVAPSSLPELGRERTVTSAATKSKKIETEKMELRAPTVRSDMTRRAADESVKDQNIMTFSAEATKETEPTKITVYKLLPSEPIMMQRNYLGDSDKGSKKLNKLNTLNFSSGYKQIVANVLPPLSDLDAKKEEKSVSSFRVILLSKNPEIINMNWYPPFDVSAYQPDRISITQPDDSNLLINFDQKYIYKVDISKDTTEALLQK